MSSKEPPSPISGDEDFSSFMTDDGVDINLSPTTGQLDKQLPPAMSYSSSHGVQSIPDDDFDAFLHGSEGHTQNLDDFTDLATALPNTTNASETAQNHSPDQPRPTNSAESSPHDLDPRGHFAKSRFHSQSSSSLIHPKLASKKLTNYDTTVPLDPDTAQHSSQDDDKFKTAELRHDLNTSQLQAARKQYRDQLQSHNPSTLSSNRAQLNQQKAEMKQERETKGQTGGFGSSFMSGLASLTSQAMNTVSNYLNDGVEPEARGRDIDANPSDEDDNDDDDLESERFFGANAFLSNANISTEAPCIYNIIREGKTKVYVDCTHSHTLDCPVSAARTPFSIHNERLFNYYSKKNRREEKRRKLQFKQQQEAYAARLQISTVREGDDDYALLSTQSVEGTSLGNEPGQLSTPIPTSPSSNADINSFLSDELSPDGVEKDRHDSNTNGEESRFFSINESSLRRDSANSLPGDPHEPSAIAPIVEDSEIAQSKQSTQIDAKPQQSQQSDSPPFNSPLSSPQSTTQSTSDSPQTPSQLESTDSDSTPQSIPSPLSHQSPLLHANDSVPLDDVPSLHALSHEDSVSLCSSIHNGFEAFDSTPPDMPLCTCGGGDDLFSARQCSVDVRADFITRNFTSLTSPRRTSSAASDDIAPKCLLLKAFTVTWNLFGTLPTTFTHVIPSDVFDLYVISLQECGTVSQGLMGGHTAYLSNLLLQAVGSDPEEFTIIASSFLQTIYTFVLIRTPLAPFVHGVSKEVVATGYGDFIGNKGGVAIRFFIGPVSICCIGAHFNSGQGQLEKRNQDYHKISGRLTLGLNDCLLSVAKNSIFPYQNWRSTFRSTSLSAHNYSAVPSHYKQFYPHYSDIGSRSDVTFFIGDLNYRVHGTKRSVEDMLAFHRHFALLHLDQLQSEVSQGTIFAGFQEGVIAFPPSYKYDPGQQCYDTSQKQRIPSWTDRILFRDNCTFCSHERGICDCTARPCKYAETASLEAFTKDDSVDEKDSKQGETKKEDKGSESDVDLAATVNAQGGEKPSTPSSTPSVSLNSIWDAGFETNIDAKTDQKLDSAPSKDLEDNNESFSTQTDKVDENDDRIAKTDNNNNNNNKDQTLQDKTTDEKRRDKDSKTTNQDSTAKTTDPTTATDQDTLCLLPPSSTGPPQVEVHTDHLPNRPTRPKGFSLGGQPSTPSHSSLSASVALTPANSTTSLTLDSDSTSPTPIEEFMSPQPLDLSIKPTPALPPRPERLHHCQRVLLEKYGCVQNALESDHRPVYAHFLLSLNLGTFSPADVPKPIFANDQASQKGSNSNPTSGKSQPTPKQGWTKRWFG